MIMRHVRALGLIATAALLASPVWAEPGRADASTKLRRCGAQTCLLISGRRADPAARVLVEQHEVAVTGGRRWQVSLPLQTVEDWAPPYARSIAVQIAGEDDRAGRVALPIGVFGRTTSLAFLSVSARH